MRGVRRSGERWREKVLRGRGESRAGAAIRAALALFVLLALGPSACSQATTLGSATSFRDANRQNLERLVEGMSRDEVLAIMGTESGGRPLGSEAGGPVRTERDTLGVTQLQIPLGARGPTLYNPQRTATYEAGGRSWEILFYYTHLVENDGQVTEAELTPIVLQDGYLFGTGWVFWRETAGRYGIAIE